jgi:hypothetical protein
MQTPQPPMPPSQTSPLQKMLMLTSMPHLHTSPSLPMPTGLIFNAAANEKARVAAKSDADANTAVTNALSAEVSPTTDDQTAVTIAILPSMMVPFAMATPHAKSAQLETIKEPTNRNTSRPEKVSHQLMRLKVNRRTKKQNPVMHSASVEYVTLANKINDNSPKTNYFSEKKLQIPASTIKPTMV